MTCHHASCSEGWYPLLSGKSYATDTVRHLYAAFIAEVLKNSEGSPFQSDRLWNLWNAILYEGEKHNVSPTFDYMNERQMFNHVVGEVLSLKGRVNFPAPVFCRT